MRLTTIGICLLLLPALVWAGTWQDDFRDGDTKGWMRFSDGGRPLPKWSVEDGVLMCDDSHTGGWGTYLVMGESTWRDFTIECDLMIAGRTPGAGRSVAGLARHQRNDGMTCYLLGSEDNALVAWAVEWNHRFLVDEVTPFALQFGEWYRVKLECVGKEHTLTVDGKRIHSFTSTLFDAGRPGFIITGALARFDNVVIAGPDVPDAGPSGYLSVEPTGKLTTAWATIRNLP